MDLLSATKLYAPYLYLGKGSEINQYDLFVLVPVWKGQDIVRQTTILDPEKNMTKVIFQVTGTPTATTERRISSAKVLLDTADWVFPGNGLNGTETEIAGQPASNPEQLIAEADGLSPGRAITDRNIPVIEADREEALREPVLTNAVVVQINFPVEDKQRSRIFALALGESSRQAFLEDEETGMATMCPYIYMEKVSGPQSLVHIHAIIPLQDYQIAHPSLQGEIIDTGNRRYTKEFLFIPRADHRGFFVPGTLMLDGNNDTEREDEYQIRIKLEAAPSVTPRELTAKSKTKNADTRLFDVFDFDQG